MLFLTVSKFNNNYNKKLKGYSRELRSESVSKAEIFIWKSLLSRGQSGVKFKRQRPIGNFIVDFFAQEIGLIIEIDGSSHLTKSSYDRYRQDKLGALGFSILRFSEREVLNQLNEVSVKIEYAIYVLKSEGNE